MARFLTVSFTLTLLSACTNVGFVDKATAAANNEFGVEVFVIASGSAAKPTNFLGAGSSFYAGCDNQTGIARANCNCQAEASGRGFSGTFNAWISISGSVDAICNIQGQAVTGCPVASGFGPFLYKSGSSYATLAENYSELSVTGFRFALEPVAGLLFSGTKIDGRASGQDCSGFTDSVSAAAVTAGDKAASGPGFTTGQSAFCNPSVGYFLCMKKAR